MYKVFMGAIGAFYVMLWGVNLQTADAQIIADSSYVSTSSDTLNVTGTTLSVRDVSYVNTLSAGAVSLQPSTSLSVTSTGSSSYIVKDSSFSTVQNTSSEFLTISYDPNRTPITKLPVQPSFEVISPDQDVDSLHIPPGDGVVLESPLVLTPSHEEVLRVVAPLDTLTDFNPQSVRAELSVNDEYILYVAYGDSAVVTWSSYGSANCSLDEISQTGTEGTYTLQNITANKIVTIACEAAPGFVNSQIYPAWLARAEIRVLPPTFDYVKTFITKLQVSSGKKVNLTNTSSFIDQSQKAHNSGKTDLAQSFLQKSKSSLEASAKKGAINTSSILEYGKAADYLSESLRARVKVAADGCSVTAWAPPGLILEYGANFQMRKGYGQQTTVPANGMVTETIYAPVDWTATGEIINADGRILARDFRDVVVDTCPTPPIE